MSVITAVGQFASQFLGVAAGFAEKEGASKLSEALENLGAATDQALNEFDDFYQQHPVEATVALTAGIVAAIAAPGFLVAGAELLPTTAMGAEIVTAIGGDAVIGNEAVTVAASVIQDWVISSGVEKLCDYAFQELNGLWETADQTSQPIGHYTATQVGGYQLQETLPDDASVTTETDSEGKPVSVDVENSDGSSDLATYCSNGSSVTTDYSGPNGTGSVTATDDENADGSSQITTYDSNGSSYSQKYSGPNGTGTAGQSSFLFHYKTTDEKTGAAVTYVAGVSFDQVGFNLASIRLGYNPDTTFGTTAHYISVSPSPYDSNEILLFLPDSNYGNGTIVSPTQKTLQIKFNTGLIQGSSGIYSNVELGASSASYFGYVSAAVKFTISGKVFAPAVGSVSFPGPGAPTTYYFHVGDTPTIPMVVTNTAQGALADALSVAVAPGNSAGVVNGVNTSGYVPQGQSATVTVGINTTTAGSYEVGASNFSFPSHDDDLADIVAAASGAEATINVNRFADPILLDVSSAQRPGVLTGGANGQWTLNFGYVLYQSRDSTAAQALIYIQDGLTTGPMDDLKGALSSSGGGFTDGYGFDLAGNFATPGGHLTLGQFSPDVSLSGSQTETITFQPISFNASGYSGVLPNQMLTITDDVVTATNAPVALFMQDKNGLDAVSGGFAIVDSKADIVPALGALAGDPNLTQVTVSDGPLIVSIATFHADQVALDKIVGGFLIADTAATIQSALTALAADTRIMAITPTGGSVNVNAASFAANKLVLDKIKGRFGVTDTAANLAAVESLLQSDHQISTITTTSNGAVVAQSTYNADGSLQLAYTVAKLANGTSDYHYAGGSFFTGKSFAAFDNVTTAAGVLLSQTLYNSSGKSIQQTQFNTNGSVYEQDTVTYAASGSIAYHFSGGSFFFGKSFAAFDNITNAAGLLLSQQFYNSGGAPTQRTYFNADGSVYLHAAITTLANGTLDQHYASGSAFAAQPYVAFDLITTVTPELWISQTFYDAKGNIVSQGLYNADGTLKLKYSVTRLANGAIDDHFYKGSFFTGKSFAAFDNITSASGVLLSQTLLDATGAPIQQTTFNANGSVYEQATISRPAAGQMLYHYAVGSFFSSQTFSAFDNLATTGGSLLEQELYNKDGSHSFTVPGNGLILTAAHNDTFTVTGKNDTVRFGATGFGADTVKGYAAGDVFSFAPSVFASFGALSQHVTGGTNAVITDAANDTLTLTGVAPSSLTAAMFKFA